MTEPVCTCKITKHRTVWDEDCFYHGKNGTMVAVVRLTRRTGPITETLAEQGEQAAIMPQWLKWRRDDAGKGTSIYAMPTGAPNVAGDVYVGRMATTMLANEVVEAHNSVLEQVQR